MSQQNEPAHTADTITLRLSRDHVHQILDGLDQRLESWTRTGQAWSEDRIEEESCLEECSSEREAFAIARLYEVIIREIRDQCV